MRKFTLAAAVVLVSLIGAAFGALVGYRLFDYMYP